MTILIQTDPVPAEVFAREIRLLSPGTAIADDPAKVDPASIEAILAWKLNDGIAGRLPNLRLVCSMASGVDKILPAKDLASHLPVVRIVDAAQALAMAQYVVVMALRHVRGLATFEAQQRAREWKRIPPPQPYTFTAAVLGLGGTGKAVASLLRQVGINVVGWSRTPKQLDGIDTFTGTDGLATALGRSNIAVCLLPSTPETAGVLNRETLGQLRPGSYLINVARGAHVVEADLAALIRSGHLAGAALDVQSQEPMPKDHALWDVPNLTITPHSSAEPPAATVAAQLLAALEQARAGKVPVNAVDRTKGY